MKRFYAGMLSVALLFGLLGGCAAPIHEDPIPGTHSQAVSEENTIPAESSTTSQEVSIPNGTLEGRVRDAANRNITVESGDGTLYNFVLQDDTEVDDGAMELDAPVKLSFEGVVDDTLAMQAVVVLKVQFMGSTPEGRIEELMDILTLNQKVNQLFLVRCPKKDALKVAEQYQFGGYCLFGRDFENKSTEQVQETIQAYQDVSQIPMLIAVDEEGGKINRVSSQPKLRNKPFISQQELYQQGGTEAVLTDALEKASFLESFGINVNLAPVCDISTDQKDYIHDRSLGQDAQTTADVIGALVETLTADGRLGTVLKHFPGYGNNVDTHTGIATDKRPYENFEENDFLPFQAGIAAGADAILVSHNIVTSMDEDSPASLSAKVHEIIREDLSFNGVLITDDLSMDAVEEFAGESAAAVKAIQAGNDLLCCTDYKDQTKAVLDAVKDGTITEERIDESVERILRWKMKIGILD